VARLKAVICGYQAATIAIWAVRSAQLMNSKMALVANCRRCKHQRVLYPANYVERFGADCPAILIREHLRCAECHGKMANLHESAR